MMKIKYWFIVAVVVLLGAWTHGGPTISGAWILITGFWNDGGVWLDSATWHD
jgi:hypothetical protein